MTKRDTHSSSREPGREHIPIYPRCFTIVRFLQLILGLVLLALSAWGLSLIRWGGTAMLLFTSIATLICSIYILVARFGPAKAHNYWAILALDIMMMIFWLVSFALMAWAAASLFVLAARIDSASNSTYDPYYYYYSMIRDSAASMPTYAKTKSSSSSSSSSYNSYSNYSSSDYYNAYEDAVLVWAAVAAVCAALGAVQFLLYLISTSIHSCAVRRHRKAGLHCKPGVAATPVAATNNPEVGYVPPPQQAAAPQAMYGQQYPVDQQQQQMPPMMQQQQQVYGAPPMMHQQQQDPNAMYAGQQGGMVSPVNPQTTGGSYVQGAPVSFDGSQQQQQQHHELQQQPHYTGSSTVGSSGPVYETHGESKA